MPVTDKNQGLIWIQFIQFKACSYGQTTPVKLLHASGAIQSFSLRPEPLNHVRRKWFDAISICILKIQLFIEGAINNSLHEEFKIFAKLVKKLIYHAHKTHHWILSHMNPAYTRSRARTHTQFKIHFNHTLSHTPRSPKWSIPFTSSNRNAGFMCSLSLRVHVSAFSSSSTCQPNNIW